MTEKYLNIDLNDDRINGIADVISNKTCKKILASIAEKEMSEGDIATELKIPLNTVGYNIKKLMEAGLIEKSSNFFWSSKGKKIPTYRISNRKIVISPKSSIKGIIPAVVVSLLAALGIRTYFGMDRSYAYSAATEIGQKVADNSASGASAIAAPANMPIPGEAAAHMIANPMWAWFLMGAFVALMVFLVWNWRKLW